MNDAFLRLVADIPRLGVDWHREAILRNSAMNGRYAEPTVREIAPTGGDVLIVSAGPSLYRREHLARIKALPERPTIVAIDGSMVAALRADIVPDFVLTLDPHPTRIVRWFGDPDIERHMAGDDYFERQDLDEAFRLDAIARNIENTALVDFYAERMRLVIASTAPESVVARTRKFRRYWFAPLVDNPRTEGSLTRAMCSHARLPAMNTGGTVGTAAVIFAHQVLKARRIAVIGMDLGYAADTPLERTQSWNMLKDRKDVADMYPRVQHPQFGECFTDATYAWYKQNLLALLKAGGFGITNCTEGGALFGPRVECMGLEAWLNG